ncbi:MAG: glycosyltransferase family 1 protein [Nitrospira sp. WS238]|nr:glycosyltransferase family 1 protein [Nitrospira sp. WS238]
MNEKLITLVHVTTIPLSLGFVAGQAAYMRARGFESHAVSSPGPSLTGFAAKESVTVHPVSMARRITPFQDLVALFQLWNLFRRLRPHIVHAHTPKGGLLGMIAARLAGVPVRIYHMHGLPFITATGLTRRILMATEAVSCWMASQVLCVSRSVRSMAIDLRLSLSEKIQVLLQGSCNGVDAETTFNSDRLDVSVRSDIRCRYGIPSDAIVIGFVGRLARAKGLVELNDAWRILRSEHPALHLLLIGPEEPGDPPPPGLLEGLRTDPRVHFVGENWDTPPLYRAMDILVLPTHREGFPLVLLEAAAMRLSIVATRVTGCLDAVQDGVTGRLVQAFDPVALADGLAQYVCDPVLRRRHGEAAREWVLREFRPEDIWKAVYQEYVRCLLSKGLHPHGEHPFASSESERTDRPREQWS